MLKMYGRVLKSIPGKLANGSELINHHVLCNGNNDAPLIFKVQDWESRKLPMDKPIEIPVYVSAWKSKAGAVGLQFTLSKGFEVK